MDGGSIERLELAPGAKVTGAHVAQLDRTIAQNQGLRGLRVRRRQYPWGIHHSYSGLNGGGDSPIFAPDVSFRGDGTAEVRWSGPRALIGGVAPTIEKAEIFTEDDQTGLRPVLLVDPTLYGSDTGECRIYFQVTTYDDFSAKVVTPVAMSGKPVVQAFTGYKLALFLRMRGGAPSYLEDADREMFCGQGFLAINQRAGGKFESLFWATF
jgi:hypothetical protein